METIISIQHVNKIYGHGTMATHALKGVSLDIFKGEFVAIMGRSGCGKSTLLHILGLLDKPTAGQVSIENRDVLKLSDYEKAQFRLREFGYIFQEYSLLAEMNLLENTFLPSLCLDNNRNYRKKAEEILGMVGLDHRLTHYPSEVSGGEMQRAAIARALINNPKIVFADEPTASLDESSSKVVLELFRRLNHEKGQTIVMVTHEPDDRKYVDRVIWMQDGLVKSDGLGGEIEDLSESEGLVTA